MNSVFLTSIIMSLIIIFFLLHRKLKGEKFTSKAYYMLWIIISIRLILPFDISIENPIYNFNSSLQSSNYTEDNIMEDKLEVDKNVNDDFNIDNNKAQTEIVEANPQKKDIDILKLLQDNISGIWLVGAIVYLSFNLTIYGLFKLRLKKSLSSVDIFLEEKFNKIKNAMNIDKKIDIKESNIIDSPMIVGLVKPILLVPKNIDRENIEYIFKHELVHLKRKDILYKAVIFMASSIHWFNPMVHIMLKTAGADLELSCDEEVVKDMAKEEKIIYGKTLINSISKMKAPIYTTNFSGGVDMIKKRLDKIFHSIDKKSSKPLILFLILSILGTSFLIGCGADKKENLTDKLYGYKTQYVGDNSKVGNIVSSLEFPKGYGYKSMKISTDHGLNSLELYFELPEKENLSTQEVAIQSAIMFSLIDNIAEIAYFSGGDGSEQIVGSEMISVDKMYVNSMTLSFLGKTIKELGSSKGNFKELVEFYQEYIEEDKAIVQLDKNDLEPTKHELVNDLEKIIMPIKEGRVNSKGATLVVLSKSYTPAIYGEDFLLENKIDGDWYELPVIIEGEYGFKDIEYEIPHGGGPDWIVDWEWLYGELQPGEYRIIKEVSTLEDTGEYKTHYLATKFTIK